MLSEERVKLFALLLKVLVTGSPVYERLKADGQEVDTEAFVRVIADGGVSPMSSGIFSYPNYVPPTFPSLIPSPTTTPSFPYTRPQTICTGRDSATNKSAMSQADGIGDDAGTRGD